MASKKKAAKKAAKRAPALRSPTRTQDIPLEHIEGAPSTRTVYPVEVKKKAVAMVMDGASHNDVAKELKIVNASIIGKWMSVVKAGGDLAKWGGGLTTKSSTKSAPTFAAGLRASLDNAARERDDRLESAAIIVEVDAGGRDGADLAKRIRTFKRPQVKG